MRKFLMSLATACLMYLGSSAADACSSAVYFPASGSLFVPCIFVVGDEQSYSANLQATGSNTFSLFNATPDNVKNPPITRVQILTSPVPAALVFGAYPNGCWSAFRKPTYERIGNTIDLRVKAIDVSSPVVLCTAAVVPFVEAINLFGVGDPTQFQYTVNGVSVTPTF